MKSDGGLRGDADCHDQFANWSRNDTVNKKRGGAAGHMGPALQPYIFVGQGPCALPGVRCGIGGRTEASAPTEGCKKCLRAGRCGERTERCRWQRKRSERVAAVKILSDSRKAAQKFWAPQQDHRPLRRGYWWCVGEGLCPSRGRGRTPPLRRGYKGCGEAAGGGQPALHYIMLLCGAWRRGCKRPFARQQGGGVPRPVGGIFASYLFRSSKFSAVTMDWTLVHRGAKVLARSS